METTTNKLKERREAAGLTQGKLADLANVSRFSINQYETQGNMPHPNNRWRIAQVLECKESDIWPNK